MPNFNDPQGTWIWVQNQIPGGVVGALIILIVGWIVARILQAVVTGALRRTGLDRRLAPAISNDPGATTAPGDTAQVIGRIVFWLVMLFVLIAVFDALGLELITAPLTGLLAGSSPASWPRWGLTASRRVWGLPTPWAASVSPGSWARSSTS